MHVWTAKNMILKSVEFFYDYKILVVSTLWNFVMDLWNVYTAVCVMFLLSPMQEPVTQLLRPGSRVED